MGSFKFVRIPQDTSVPIESLEGSTEGGLTKDYLLLHAKKYFRDDSNRKPMPQVDAMSPEQKKALAARIRQQAKQHATDGMVGNLEEVSDDVILSMYTASTSGESANSCDIIALTVPTAQNQFNAVSMYLSNQPVEESANMNARAMSLLEGCGHAPRKIYGDVFCGRALDNETTDIWVRTDFMPEDASPNSEWCRTAKERGGGGGSGMSSASSLSGLAQQMMQNPSQVQSPYGNNPDGEALQQQGVEYTWLQSDEDVELKFQLSAATKAKYIKVNFKKTSIKVTVSGQTLLQGTLGGPISVDESTYTLQDSSRGAGKELCVNMSKASPGAVWTTPVQG